MAQRIITVFGSGRVKEGEPGYRQAAELGRLLARAGYAVCNGGYGGVMEASARGAREAGGRTIGITMSGSSKPANAWIGEPRPQNGWRERLFKLVETGDAYILLDGGTGTLAELFVVWEMTNQELIRKPIVLLGPSVRALLRDLRRDKKIIRPPVLKSAPNPSAALRVLDSCLR